MTMAALLLEDSDPAVRIAARREAEREGLALGPWLDRVMIDYAVMRGIGLVDLDDVQRIEAIKLRLDRVADPKQAGRPVKPRAGVGQDSADELIGRDRPIRDDSGRDGMTSVALLRQSFKDFTMHDDTAAWTLPTERGAGSRPQSGGQRTGAPLWRASERQEIETKLNALFTALDKTPRRADHAAAAEPEIAGEIEAETRIDILLGETAISPAWRLDRAIGEIADRQAFLERQAIAEGLAPATPRPSVAARFGAPNAAAADIRRQFEQPNARDEGLHGDPAAVPAADPVPSVFSSLQGDLARLAKRLDAVGRDVARPPASVRRQASVEDIRALLHDMRPDASIEALGRQVDSISAKLDQITGQPLPAEAIDRLSRRIEEVYGEILALLSAQRAVPSIDMEAMERLIRDIVPSANQPAPASPDLRALERAVHDLATKLDHAERPRGESDHLVELKAQVGTLAERLDKSDAGLTAIVAMERSLGDLFVQIGQMQSVAVQATEATARIVAQDTIQDAVQANLAEAQLDRLGSAATDAAVGRVSRDLAEFRATRDDADRQLQSILSALNASLERVVDRLAALETDVAEEGSSSEAGFASLRPETVAGRPLGRQSGEPLDLDRPLEPSVRLPSTDIGPDPTTFIAAARRAAATAEQSLRVSEATDARVRVEATPSSSKWFKAGKPTKRRPLILALASLMILAGAIQAVRVSMTGGEASLAQPTEGRAATPPADSGSAAAAKATDAVPAAGSVAPTLPTTAAGAESGVQATGPVPAAAPLAVTASAEQPGTAMSKPGAEVAAATAAAVPAAPSKIEIAAAPDAPASAQAPLPTMAMGPKASIAAMQAADLAGKAAAVGGIPAELRAEAEAGTAAAQYEVGLRYADGRGVARDLSVAASWFDKAARQGLAPAAYRLGSAYEKGFGLPRDAAQSVFWYGKAADAGNVRAMHNLAVMLAEGATSKPDYTTAAGWFTKAAEAGVRDSQYNLAILYARGMGVEQSLRRAYTWFAIAAAQGDADSAKKRDDVEARLDPDGLAEAKRAVADFKPAATAAAANEVLAPAGGWDASSPPLRLVPAAATPKPAGKEHLGKV